MNPNDTEHQTMNPQADSAPEALHEAASAPEADPVAVLEAEKADLKDKLLRLMADMENLRRRIESVPAEASRSAEGAFKGLIEGIDLTERDLLKTLERHGVKKLEPQGQKFDPNLHQAMFEVPNPEVPNGTVVQVVQSGYVIGDRVLRPALVGVAKGGPKGAAQDQPPAEAA